MKIALLCGYRDTDPNEDALGIHLIDKRIEEIEALGFGVICVLGGKQADEQLRNCPRIPDCELIFDTEDHTDLLSNVRAAVFAPMNEPILALPVEIPVPPREFVEYLYNEYAKAGFAIGASFVQAVTLEGAPYQHGFPMLITRAGRSLLQAKTDLKSLTDTRLEYLRVSYPPPLRPLESEDLAPTAIPL